MPHALTSAPRPPAPDGCRRARCGVTERGFSVLEALVAMALLAVAFIPLLYLQGQMTRTVAAMERAERAYTQELSVRNFAANLNPMLHPQGSQPLGDAVFEWTARPAGAPAAALQRIGQGRYEVQLFDVDFTLTGEDGTVRRWTARRMGWRPFEPFLDN